MTALHDMQQFEPTETTFADRLFEIMTGGALSLMISLGHRSGLFDTMSKMPPATAAEIASKAGLAERYVREWLGAMTTGRIVHFDPYTRTFTLPAEHAAYLTRAAAPNNLAVGTQFISVLGSVEDQIASAMKSGEGVPYAAYKRFHAVMAEESSQTVVAALESHIMPMIPGLRAQLELGINVLDVGCGSGRAIIHLATMFPQSHFIGIDLCRETVENATMEAESRHLNNVSFMRMDAADMLLMSSFDLVTTFDAVHDQSRPKAVLANIRKALKPNGVYLMQEIRMSSHLEQNMENPLAPFIYSISTMHCMAVALCGCGAGLGAAWGREKAHTMLREAGFTKVEMKALEHDPMNDWYIVRP